MTNPMGSTTAPNQRIPAYWAILITWRDYAPLPSHAVLSVRGRACSIDLDHTRSDTRCGVTEMADRAQAEHIMAKLHETYAKHAFCRIAWSAIDTDPKRLLAQAREQYDLLTALES